MCLSIDLFNECVYTSLHFSSHLFVLDLQLHSLSFASMLPGLANHTCLFMSDLGPVLFQHLQHVYQHD